MKKFVGQAILFIEKYHFIKSEFTESLFNYLQFREKDKSLTFLNISSIYPLSIEKSGGFADQLSCSEMKIVYDFIEVLR